jgi:predicted HicB family RNase H-like nuclease
MKQDKPVSGKKTPPVKSVADATAPKKKAKDPETKAAAATAPKKPKAKADKVADAAKPEKIKKNRKDIEQPPPKEAKVPKDDKSTKFLVSMKKSLRKSLKKEAAELGVSMNEFIVSAVEAKLGPAPAEPAPKASKK